MSPTPESTTIAPTSAEVSTRFKEILKSNGVTDPVAEVIIKDSGLRGENLASVTNRVTVNFENASIKPLELFMKSTADSGFHAEMLKEGKMFEKESRFFMEYIPAAREFCKSMGQEELMSIYPKCYYGDGKMLVFDNLVVNKGFSLLNKIEKQDFDAAKIAVTSLAKHHAISSAYIKSMCGGSSEAFFERFPNLDYEPFAFGNLEDPTSIMFADSIENGLATNISLIQKSDSAGAAKAIEIIKSMQGKGCSLMVGTSERLPEFEKMFVLNHGDYWNNNMMFKVDPKTKKILDHIMVDFQVLRYNSPSLDLSYFLFTSVKPAVRREKLKDLLNIYMEAFNTTTKKLGAPVDITFDELFLEFRKKYNFGFMMSIVLGNGVGFLVLKDMDPAELKDFSEFFSKMDMFIKKWVEEHPEEAKKISEDLVLDMEQYAELRLVD